MKKTRTLILTGFLIVFTTGALLAQQGSVSAGSDATGTGGSMSYSIGQVDYQFYISDQGSMSFGLQQTWFISDEPPLTLEISDLIIQAGESLCFNALETVTVAGDGNQFIVQAYGHADIIANQSIILKHGTSVELYGSLHARISNIWCPPQQSMLATFYEQPEHVKQSFEPMQNSGFFKVYPNPTTGDFTLELLSVEEASLILIEIYTLQGNLISKNELPAERRYNLSLADRQPGIYLIRFLRDHEIGTGKIIKK